MAKRFSISLKNSEYEQILNEAEKMGLKPVDLLNRAIRNSLKDPSKEAFRESVKNFDSSQIETMLKVLKRGQDELKREQEDLKKEVRDSHETTKKVKFGLKEAIRINIDYLSFLKTLVVTMMQGVWKSLPSEEFDKKMEELLNKSIVESKKNFDKTTDNF